MIFHPSDRKAGQCAWRYHTGNHLRHKRSVRSHISYNSTGTADSLCLHRVIRRLPVLYTANDHHNLQSASVRWHDITDHVRQQPQ